MVTLDDIIALAQSISKQVSAQYESIGIQSMIFVEPNIFRSTLVDGTVINIPIANFNNFTSEEKTMLDRFSYINNQLLFDGKSLDKQIDLSNYVQEEAGKGLFSGNYNDLINKPATQQPNKSISFTASDWVQDTTDTSKYILEITHGLKTIDVIGVVFNSLGDEETMGFKPIDIDRVRLTNTSPTNGRVVLNYTSTISTSTSTGISDLTGFTSDDLAEGSNNKYLTPSEKTIVESINLTAPTDKQVLSYDDATGKLVNETIHDEKVKLNSSSTTAEYLGDLIDNSTIQISGNKIIAKSLEGQVVTLTELNYISGLDENIMTKFSNFLNGGIQVYTNKTFSSYSELLSFNFTTLTAGKIYLMYISKDETHTNNGTTYMCHSTTNNTTNLPYYCGLSTATQRDLGVDKVDLTSEVKNLLPQSNIDMTGILKKTDIIDDMIHSDIDKPSSANQVKILKGQVDTKTQVNDSGIAGNTTDTYSVDKIIALLNDKQNKIFIQSTQPSSPNLNTLWVDTTNSTGYKLKCFNGTGFIQIGSSSSGLAIDNWATLTSYTIGTSFVINANLLYRCKTTHISGTTFDIANWILIGGDVTTDGVQTLKNKSLIDSSTTIIDEIDNTKKTQFDASGITTGQTRTLTIPDKDGTIALTSDIKTMTGATSSVSGTNGNVPQPLVGHQDASLKGDGNWDKTGKGTKISLSNQSTSVTLINTATVDVCEFLEISQSTSSVTITLPTPSVTSSSRRLIVTNTGSAGFTMNSQTVNASSSIVFYWSPTLLAWTTTPSSSMTSTSLAYGYYGINDTIGLQSVTASTWTRASGTATTIVANNISNTNGYYKFTITQAGTYEILSASTLHAIGASAWVQSAIYKNGTSLISTKAYVSTAGSAETCSTSYVGTFAVGDYIELYAYLGTAGYFNGGYLSVKQLPSATYVPANALTSTPLNWLKLGGSASYTTVASSAIMLPQTAKQGSDLSYNSSTGVTSIGKTSNYKITYKTGSLAVTNAGVIYLQTSTDSGSTWSIIYQIYPEAPSMANTYYSPQEIHWEGNLASGTYVRFYSVSAVTQGASADIVTFPSAYIEEIPSATVISPSSVSVTEWTAYTPTITATTNAPTLAIGTDLKAMYKVIGKTLFINFNLYSSTAGTAGSGNYLISIPSGYTINTSLIRVAGSGYDGSAIGTGTISLAGSYTGTTKIVAVSNSLLGVWIQAPWNTNSTSAYWSSSVHALGTGITNSFVTEIPIL